MVNESTLKHHKKDKERVSEYRKQVIRAKRKGLPIVSYKKWKE